MTDFNDVWPKLVQYAKENSAVYTFVRGSENRLDYDDVHDAIVLESDNPDIVPRETWKNAWEELRREGELTIASFKDATGTYRASASLPFLADALDLPRNPSDRRIWLPDDGQDE